MGKQFSDVHFEAEQATEVHRTLENDRTVTEVDLPGLVNVYLVIDGGRILFDQIKAPRVLEAIETAKKNRPAQTTSAEQPQQTSGTPDSGPQSEQTG